LVGTQLIRRVCAAVVDQRVLKDPAHRRGVRPELDLHPGRKVGGDLGDVLQHPGAGPVHVGAILEDYVHVAEAEVRKAADGLHLGRAQKCGGDRIGDLVLDDVGAPVPPGVDDDLSVRKVGQRVQWDGPHRPPSEGQGHDGGGDDQVAVLSREADDLLDHGRCPL
jgi:hypothetical protein